MRIVPVYGEGFFHVTWGLIYYTIIFDYIDLEGEYYEYVRDPRARRMEERESKRLMQEAMDSERTIINGVEVRPIVDTVKLHFRGGRRRHSLTFHIRIPYNPLEGVNVYENYYEPSRAEYPYTVYWILPPNGKVRLVESPGRVAFRNRGRIAVIQVKRGTKITGYEAVEFEIKRGED